MNCQNLVTLFPYIAIWWINWKVPEGSTINSENSSATRESSRVIILKSRLNPARARYVTFLIVRPMYPMTDDSWCAHAFSNLEAAIQWQRPSVILNIYMKTKLQKYEGCTHFCDTLYHIMPRLYHPSLPAGLLEYIWSP